MFLRGEDRIKNCEPRIVRSLYEGINLELYVANSGAGKDTWAIAVVAVEKRFSIFRTKYDSAKINGDLGIMANECVKFIKTMYGEKHFKDLANGN